MSNLPPSLAGFRWAQGSNNDSSAAAGAASSSNAPFYSTFTNSISGYIPLRSGERSNEDEAYFALSRWERFVGFLLCCAGAAACFAIAFFIGIPLVAIKPRKFATAFSLGSILFMCGFAILQGPVNQAKHMLTPERLPFTAVYLGSLGLTLYFAIGQRSYLPTLICAIVQCGALLSYLVAYFPGGMATLTFGSRMALRGAGSLLPV